MGLKILSIEFFRMINNIVDNQESEYYFVNKKRRYFWHSRPISISCKVREKNNFNDANNFRNNIRAFLLNEDNNFFKELSKTWEKVIQSDYDLLREFVKDLYPKIEEKKIGIVLMNMDPLEKKRALGLEIVVTCRILGYENEFFYLYCYWLCLLPVLMLRVLYHTDYCHPEQIEEIEFIDLLSRIKFNK